VYGGFMFISFISSFILIQKFNNSRYFKLFWNDNLVLFDFKIDNVYSYLSAMFVLIVLSILEVFRDTYVDPWLYNVLFDPNVKEIKEMYEIEVYTITILDAISEIVTKFIGFGSAYAQFDFFLILLITVVFTLIFVIRTYTKDKTFYPYPNNPFFKFKYIVNATKEYFSRNRDSLIHYEDQVETETEIEMNEIKENPNFDLPINITN
jgi:hypothetical protein